MTDDAIPEGNTDEAVKFLENMFPGMPRHLVAMDLKGRPIARTFGPDELKKMRAWINARQGRFNLYFHVNALRAGFANKKATKDDVAVALRFHTDIDDATAGERILKFTPPPSVIVFSGGGYHPYWNLAEPTDDLSRVEASNLAIAKALGGDNCHNIDRILRLPGTVNIPNAGKAAKGRKPELARIVKSDWSLRYSLDEPASPAWTTGSSNTWEPRTHR